MVLTNHILTTASLVFALSALTSGSVLPRSDKRSYAPDSASTAGHAPSIDDSLLAGLVEYLYKRGQSDDGNTVYVTQTITSTTVSTSYPDTCPTSMSPFLSYTRDLFLH